MIRLHPGKKHGEAIIWLDECERQNVLTLGAIFHRVPLKARFQEKKFNIYPL